MDKTARETVMRRFVILPVLLAGAVACNADAREESAVPGTGSGTARDYAVGDFGAVSLAGSQNVIVTVSGEPSVRAEGSEEALERLEILVENGTLKIRTRNRSGIGWNRSAGPVTVHVSAPRISAASIGGSGDMRIDRVEADRLNASVAGSGNLTIDTIRVGAGNFSIAGSGKSAPLTRRPVRLPDPS
jgi:hypothetical protein